MSLCSLCGYPTGDPDSVCRHHSADHGDGWARGNRLMCDLLHRGIAASTPEDVDRLERPERYGGSMQWESEASGYVDLPGYV
jgi:hypothetical protein